MFHGSSMFAPSIHWSVYGTSKFGLRNEMLRPLLFARPSELPTGCRNPVGKSALGNGLSSDATGTPISGPLVIMLVVWLKPSCWTPPQHAVMPRYDRP